MSRIDFLKPINDLAYCCECAAQDYTGELKSELAQLCLRIKNKSQGYEAPEIQVELPKLESALENYRSSNKGQGAMLLASASRNWWAAVEP